MTESSASDRILSKRVDRSATGSDMLLGKAVIGTANSFDVGEELHSDNSHHSQHIRGANPTIDIAAAKAQTLNHDSYTLKDNSINCLNDVTAPLSEKVKNLGKAS